MTRPDWTIPLPASTEYSPAPPQPPAPMSTVVHGRYDLAGSVAHAPRSVAFWFFDRGPGVPDWWRAEVDGRPIWVEGPSGIVTNFEAQHGLRIPPGGPALFRHPAPELVALCSVAATTGWLGVGDPLERSPSSTPWQGRPTVSFASANRRLPIRVVADELTGLVLSVDAKRRQGPLTLSVVAFDLIDLDESVFDHAGAESPWPGPWTEELS